MGEILLFAIWQYLSLIVPQIHRDIHTHNCISRKDTWKIKQEHVIFGYLKAMKLDWVLESEYLEGWKGCFFLFKGEFYL